MKRLLAAGSGDIYQICQVFRAGERSRLHNPEFTMIEWYRLGFDLAADHGGDRGAGRALLLRAAQRCRRSSSSATTRRSCASCAAMRCDAARRMLARAVRASTDWPRRASPAATRDELLDFLVATVVGPRLGRGRLTCLHHYPASQAALAQLDADDPRTALRFELYAEGVELANGFVELADARRAARALRRRTARSAQRAACRDAQTRRAAAGRAGSRPARLRGRRAGIRPGGDAGAGRHAASMRCMAFPWERA